MYSMEGLATHLCLLLIVCKGNETTPHVAGPPIAVLQHMLHHSWFYEFHILEATTRAAPLTRIAKCGVRVTTVYTSESVN